MYGGADCVGLGSQNGAKNIYSTGDALQKFGEAGLQDYNPVGKTMYACAGYFKMGATDKQTGIILPALKIGRKKASNVELTFETCPNIGGSGKADAVTVTVEIVEGPGTVNGNSDRESEAMKPDQTWKWTPMSVKLYAAGESRCDRRRKRLFPLVSRQREDRESSAQLTAINSKSE